MPALRLMHEGSKRLLECALGVRSPMTIRAHLFKSNITPTEDDADSVYTTAEADFSGYATVVVASFGAAAADPSDAERFLCAASAAAVFAWSAGSGIANDIYGYYYTDDADGAVLAAQRFGSAPLDMSAAGETISFVPTISNRSEYA